MVADKDLLAHCDLFLRALAASAGSEARTFCLLQPWVGQAGVDKGKGPKGGAGEFLKPQALLHVTTVGDELTADLMYLQLTLACDNLIALDQDSESDPLVTVTRKNAVRVSVFLLHMYMFVCVRVSIILMCLCVCLLCLCVCVCAFVCVCVCILGPHETSY
jgi:hypothetical protein